MSLEAERKKWNSAEGVFIHIPVKIRLEALEKIFPK